jgi:flagellar protein FlgJ
MINTTAIGDQSSKLALDTKGLSDLKQSAKAGSPEALKSAARQFEAMFINMMMKAARQATPAEGPTDNEQTKMFTGMLDQQLSQNLAKRGVGLADVLVRQLSAQASSQQALAIGGDQNVRTSPAMPAGLDADALLKTPGALLAPSSTPSGKPKAAHIQSFQDKLSADAELASAATGIPAKFMLGQAALETGWGKRVMQNPDGSSSNNLFGIKAGASWKGKTVTAVTTEYVNGVPTTRSEKFRAYDSPADSFKDYANLLKNNPRYDKVLANATDASGFAQGLQRAGYATDPMYAAKLTRIIKHSLA